MSNLPPLDGIQVVSLEHAIAAPLCTRQMAELGARVIKVERRESGDFARGYDGRVKGQSSHFVWTNRGKESLTLDLKKTDGREIVSKLLATTDVLVQNLAPGAAARLGLAFQDLHDSFSQLIVCDITGYGNQGPYQNKKAYDLLVQAEAGLLTVTGSPQQMAKAGISIADIAAASQAHSAILAALLQRSKTGRGSHIEISLLESMVEWMGFPLYYAFDGAPAPVRSGTDHASIYPYGMFPSGDERFVMLGIQNEREWQAFCQQVLLNDELAEDTRFKNNAARSEARDDLYTLICGCFSKLSLSEICQRLEKAKIAYAEVNDMNGVWNHPQLKELKRLVEIDTPEGPVPAFLPPGNNSGFKPHMGAVPDLGQHTEQVLLELGYTQDQIARLQAEHVV